jgi:replicative DNA helicase
MFLIVALITIVTPGSQNRDDKRPQLVRYLREFWSIEQDADVVTYSSYRRRISPAQQRTTRGD